MTLSQAERYLRRDDKALRLRYSLEGPHILVERKTFRGRIGSVSKQLGELWMPDSGIRKELGHVLVATLPRDGFDAHVLRDSLMAADSWKREAPLWRQAEEADERKRAMQIRRRRDGMRYKASEVFDRYVWKHKQRVSVPVSLTS